ncbi:MAG TPA: NADH-quinone oxidoreductase subunit NuoH [Povalibacter sp.]|uniref:NADH-quinone oxidoreductase subunit NuoH n=1 Tax=Povalibacter sp. TaxID=1962978 RepID=UPI002B96718B|nr:NADH-quinone oxidoreductase subunit NuoH [Povalibacter sp.]HMN45710.1 NADH-quinone oxidoreductase subunit NuoH [Povalibacter sp.]
MIPEIAADLLSFLPQWIQAIVWYGVVAVILFISVILIMAFLTLAERRVIGSIQARIGPNRVGPFGILQPFADVLKLLVKEIVIPEKSNKFLFLLAPLLALIPALCTWAVVPLWPGFTVSSIDAGLLYILALTSAGVYGVILAGWAANSKYAFLGAMRAAAQMVAYEIAMGFALVGVVMAAGSLNLSAIIEAQRGVGGFFFWWMIPLFVVYFISGLAETNRAPFDVVEGESEIVAGFHVEYSGMAFAVFFVAEYVNMILISALTAVFFFGGWLSPFEGWNLPGWLAWINTPHPLVGFLWLFSKIAFFLFCFLWFRATFPRYRYDQIMRLGWKVFIPVTLVWIAVLMVLAYCKIGPWAG